jgi:hypothetical protein
LFEQMFSSVACNYKIISAIFCPLRGSCFIWTFYWLPVSHLPPGLISYNIIIIYFFALYFSGKWLRNLYIII